jgi:hypothetical protein
VVSVDSFAEFATKYEIEQGQHPANTAKFVEDQKGIIRIVRRSWALSGLSVLSAIALGWLAGALVQYITPRLGLWREVTQYSGGALILWGTLGRVGWVIQTWGGRTLAERVNEWFYRGMQWVGTFLLTVSVSTYG